MIEFALLFGLGFLTAAFLFFLIAPAVHRRIVWFTEKRLRATMPLSPQEVRAQKDMARARYAAENAKTEQDLAREREKTTALELRREDLLRHAGQLASENGELQSQIDEMSVEAGDLRSRLRREESYISQLKSSLRVSEHANSEKEADLDAVRKRLNKATSDADNLKIDLATRETEIESLKARANALRDERDTLRQQLNEKTKQAKDAQIRLVNDESRIQRLEDRLGREIAGNADKETVIERRMQEVGRLKDKLKAANAEAREAARALRMAGVAAKPALSTKPLAAAVPVTAPATETSERSPAANGNGADGRIATLAEDVRNRSNALSNRLLTARTAAHDKAMRDEIATIAAGMVALTALKEGEQSPIHEALAKDGDAGRNNRVSLAERSADLISDDH